MGTVNQHIAIRDARAAREVRDQRAGGDVRALRLRLDHAQYRRLRRFVTSREAETGQRLTHQAILETALAEYLESHDPAPT